MNYAQLSTTLAALRYLQANLDDEAIPEMSHFDDVDPLTPDEIDELCEKLGTGSIKTIDTSEECTFVSFHAEREDDTPGCDGIKDEWQIHEQEKDADNAFQESLESKRLHSAGYAILIKGTDW